MKGKSMARLRALLSGIRADVKVMEGDNHRPAIEASVWPWTRESSGRQRDLAALVSPKAGDQNEARRKPSWVVRERGKGGLPIHWGLAVGRRGKVPVRDGGASPGYRGRACAWRRQRCPSKRDSFMRPRPSKDRGSSQVERETMGGTERLVKPFNDDALARPEKKLPGEAAFRLRFQMQPGGQNERWLKRRSLRDLRKDVVARLRILPAEAGLFGFEGPGR